jgi:hypothetical protein
VFLWAGVGLALSLGAALLPGPGSLQAQDKGPRLLPGGSAPATPLAEPIALPAPPPGLAPLQGGGAPRDLQQLPPGKVAIGVADGPRFQPPAFGAPSGLGVRFRFTIDPKTPLKDLLPVAPKFYRGLGPDLTDDLSRVPEVVFQSPYSKELAPEKAMERIAHQIAKINLANKKATDAFIKTLVENRPDLAGLPFAMGEACRTKGEQSRQFSAALATIRRLLQNQSVTTSVVPVQFEVLSRDTPVGFPPGSGPAPPPPTATLPGATSGTSSKPLPTGPPKNVQKATVFQRVETVTSVGIDTNPDNFWEQYRTACAQEDRQAARRDKAHCEHVTLARIAALMQVLGPQPPGMRLGLVQYLAGVSHPEATRALAKLVLFSPECEVRQAAVEALKVRRERDYTDILLQGFHYPWPAVARRASEAVVKLERTDLLPQLVALLDEPDPRAPVVKDKKPPVVRELVRLNHHQSCLVCHAPGNTSTVSPETVTAPVPVPGQPMAPPSSGYGSSIPDILVRVDVTYLRQDFSVLQPVADAAPWPEMQRFDFLVRTREVSAQEAQDYRAKLQKNDPGFVSPYHRAVLSALRELTGRDTEPTAQAWRQLLKLKGPKHSAERTD